MKATAAIFLIASIIGVAVSVELGGRAEPEIDPPIPPVGRPSDYKNLSITVREVNGEESYLWWRVDSGINWWPDPYVVITAYRRDGPKVTRRTSVKSVKSHRVVFNENLNFGRGIWESIYVEVWDSDWPSSDDNILKSSVIGVQEFITGRYRTDPVRYRGFENRNQGTKVYLTVRRQ
uniref:C2 domain-containing protein n=1 Tax=Rhodosorus marinus TaxID=101924 RepID=A0A7S2ZKW0_9RHOD|mmetsp:Transcript_23181/g.92559  ORF Transcript_23181/g.92559 Transcript_23181/m.92559 type:complete len:177 (+) Transcript_23181:63-593(+)|eukprot:CAMPEP_0113956056 /NCGR_PEP_ID=MMETSP0011_2-20120614/1812_1 /TAXON_ID=101924 /ORGANISM="Rhodosorus marinus" /LENGTH=176 /DNA_ID=CAMNT_0000966085 /DNA_START=21 /DNA_END=551 /DNA_ORIENTATION=+ /assembly_acc=CAM_ASM_000156